MVKCENCVVIFNTSPSNNFPCVSMNIAMSMQFLKIPNKFSFLENRRYKQQTQSIYLYLGSCLNVIDTELLTEYNANYYLFLMFYDVLYVLYVNICIYCTRVTLVK